MNSDNLKWMMCGSTIHVVLWMHYLEDQLLLGSTINMTGSAVDMTNSVVLYFLHSVSLMIMSLSTTCL